MNLENDASTYDLLLVIGEYKGGRILDVLCKLAQVKYVYRGTDPSGAFANSVITRTKVPPMVHQRLKELIWPTAFVPTVLSIPDARLTPHAIAVISTRVSEMFWPISIKDAI